MAAESVALRNIPNFITGVRLLLLPAFAYLVLTYPEPGATEVEPGRLSAMWTLIVIGVSDVVDGALARAFGWVTPIGKILDPLADKLAQVTGLVLFTFFAEPGFQAIPIALLLVVLARDLTLLTGTLILSHRDRLEIRPGVVGKAATFVMFVLLAAVAGGLWSEWISLLSYGCAALVALSLATYIFQGIKLNRAAPAESAMAS